MIQKSLSGRYRAGKIADWSPVVWFCLSVTTCVALFIIALSIGSANQNGHLTVVNVYCASAAIEPFRKVIDQFNSSELARSKEIIVEITRTGGSGALTGQLSTEALAGVHNMADILISADSNRMSNLIDKKVISESLPIATQFPVIAILNSENPDLDQGSNLSSLLNLKVKLGVGSVTSAIGFETRRIAKSNHCLDRLQAHKTADFENVMALAQALSVGSIDAAIVWDSTVHQFNQTDNRPIKILTYLHDGTGAPVSIPLDPKENGSSPKQNFSPAERFGKFSADIASNSSRPGCFVKAGRSISDSHQADLFFNYLKTNRDEVLSSFVGAGFSNLSLESSLNNGRESNQQ